MRGHSSREGHIMNYYYSEEKTMEKTFPDSPDMKWNNDLVRKYWHNLFYMKPSLPYIYENLQITSDDFEAWKNGEADFDMEQIALLDNIIRDMEDYVNSVMPIE